jgi:hypothetical protein
VRDARYNRSTPVPAPSKLFQVLSTDLAARRREAANAILCPLRMARSRSMLYPNSATVRMFSSVKLPFISSDLNSAIPEPANSHVDFTVVDFLKLGREVHTSYFRRPGFSCLPRRLSKQIASSNVGRVGSCTKKRRKSRTTVSTCSTRRAAVLAVWPVLDSKFNIYVQRDFEVPNHLRNQKNVLDPRGHFGSLRLSRRQFLI